MSRESKSATKEEKTTTTSADGTSADGLAVTVRALGGGVYQLVELHIEGGKVVGEKLLADPNAFQYAESRAGKWLAQYASGKGKGEIHIQ